MSFYVGNSNELKLTGLKNNVTGEYINSSVVHATIKDLDGVSIPGIFWPVVLNYIADSDGDYMGVVSEDLVIIAGTECMAEIISDNGNGLVGFWKIRFYALERRV